VYNQVTCDDYLLSRQVDNGISTGVATPEIVNLYLSHAAMNDHVLCKGQGGRSDLDLLAFFQKNLGVFCGHAKKGGQCS